MKAILSIDGGGIRGLVPARILEWIERETQKPTASLFDLISGTSTGGILSCGVTMPEGIRPRYAATEICNLYRKEGKRIFHRSAWHRIRTADGNLGPKYPIDGLEDVMREYFGNSTLGESLVPIMVTTYFMGEGDKRPGPRFWKSYEDPLESRAMVAIATSCAPTYFPPYEGHIDGGIFGTNTSSFAAFEAGDLWTDETFLMLSLGTGELDRPRDLEKAKKVGPIGWIKDLNLLGMIFDGHSDAADHNSKRAIGREQYLRLQYDLPDDCGGMDDASEKNLDVLDREANRLIKSNEEQLHLFIDKLLAIHREVPQ